jgi:hypothetical protein
MSFLDNLEDSLKSLENVSDRDGASREQKQRRTDAEAHAKIAPWAEQLKKSPYTEELMKAATREGFKLRTKVYIAWMGDTLRFDARERRMELRPVADGVRAVFLSGNEEIETRAVDFESDPAELVADWLKQAN